MAAVVPAFPSASRPRRYGAGGGRVGAGGAERAEGRAVPQRAAERGRRCPARPRGYRPGGAAGPGAAGRDPPPRFRVGSVRWGL